MSAPAKIAAPHGSLRDTGYVVGWGLVLWGAVQFAASMLARNATAATAVQASIAEWGTARMAIAWTDPMAPSSPWQAKAKRMALGAGWGAIVAAVGVAAALATRTATLADGPRSVEVLTVGLVVAALSAVRDELLLRGVVLRAARDVLPAWAGLLACAGAAACARLGIDGQMSPAVPFDALRGAALAALWVRDRGAWMAIGANVGWTWAADSVARGGAIDARFGTDVAADGPMAAAVAAAAVGASIWAMRGSSRPPLRAAA